MSQANKSFSILIVDDNEAIHDDLKKILLPETVDPSLSADEALLFGTQSAPAVVFAIDSAFQGQQSLALVRKALAEDRPYAMAFIDVRMPPGWDGIETIEHLWEADPDLQVVICTAYSDYDWNVISQRLGVSENFVILRKPFDNIEVSQLAHALTAKWTSMRLARLRVEELDRQVEERTADLRKTEEKYRAIFEDAVIGIFQASPNGKLITVNRAFASMHGYDSVEQLLAHPHDVMIEMAQIKRWTQTLEEQDVVRGAEVEVNCQNGSRKWMLVNIRAARDPDGTVLYHEGTVEDITARKHAQQQVNFLAYYDALTGLPNRALLQDRLREALNSACRERRRSALLFLDLDRFKIINDSLGHSFGDLLLRQVADRLRAQIRKQDTVARVGGDEFLVLLPGVETIAEVQSMASRIVSSLTGEFIIQGRSLSVSCSLGISIFPEHGGDEETLIKNADAAMYNAKEKGCNTFCLFTDEMNARVMERLTMENSLRTAIERNELFLVYQPQIEIASGKMVGLEALLRWKHPALGLVSPDRFIRVAENSGLITSIGEWVLRTACSQLMAWKEEGLAIVPVAVNVSAVQFRHEGFCDLVRKVLEDTRLAPRYVDLELTESLLLSNADVVYKVLHELQDMGVKLVIDDFGTGYSSLSYLRHFPVTKLKIDRSFIHDVAGNLDAAAITTAIISMSRGLSLKVLAEGVETSAQLEFLRDHGCGEFQGFFFSKPPEATSLRQMLAPDSPLLPANSEIAGTSMDQK
ncbi:MAG TPA: EAL domain-containing protein [Acidobacteriaceae bacterium]|jgi:diguanylate cyclase (GGDEF)-like protein/PAS domain S-box-containing protein